MPHKTTLDLLLNSRTDKAHGPPAKFKSLLVLLVLSRWSRYGDVVFAYREICQPLSDLMKRFRSAGVSRVTPEMPFWRLQNNGAWEVKTSRGEEVHYQGDRGPTHTELLEQDARGRFRDKVAKNLYSTPSLAFEVISLLLGNFTPAQQSALMKQLGMWPNNPSETKIRQAHAKGRRSAKRRS